ncbi:hypothetical protein F4804DRAFT_339537 [Jackrogersella minutella]|nr:hypothetical protein F4804DRAFT_339537 [Jackrogersella minutella]
MTITTKTKKENLDQAFFDYQDPIYAISQSNVQCQKLDNGHVVMGYGSPPKIREYSPDGFTVMTAQCGSARPGDGILFS